MNGQSDEIRGCAKLRRGSPPARDCRPGPQVQVLESRPLSVESTFSIAIASTFSADPLWHPLTFWMRTLSIAAEITLAPYAQIMQELLSRDSLLARNRSGFNVLLIRIEDWLRDRLLFGASAEQNIEHIRRVANEFVTAMRVIRAETITPIFVFLCPSSSSLSSLYTHLLEEIQGQLMTELDTLPGVQCWTHADVVRLYPVAGHEDHGADRIGHIPYTDEYFVAIATCLARRIAALVKPQYKVIAIDCDNTLWRGICGEDGAAGVELTPAHVQFQKLLIRQHDAGMVLCLCSRNSASDVEAVFRDRPEMPLREHHLISSRVNWCSKSSNLQSLAQELGLSLDSFIFIDDDPVECAEVQAQYPSVLTLRFPETQEGVAHFLDHVWAFDCMSVTEEAKRRTALYQENRARDVALERAPNLERFLASLELKVEVSWMQSGQLTRVAELIQRTNQFNLTTIRQPYNEIEAHWKSGDLGILVVHVRDRFGDYGLVGALVFRREPPSIDVTTFVMSCRVLGRGVETRIVNELARVAQHEGLTHIVLRYRQTPRNTPAWEFLEKSFTPFQDLSSDPGESAIETVFRIPVDYAERLGTDSSAETVTRKAIRPMASANTAQPASSTDWHGAAYRLSRPADVVREINLSAERESHAGVEYAAPRTPTEATVAGIWAEVLGLGSVGVRDNFFELGGDSIQAVRAIARIGSVLGLDLSITELFEGPTVEEVAGKLTGASPSGPAIQRIGRDRPIRLSLAPQAKVEEVLTRIWQELLQVERIGRDDNFFELGGHSLLAAHVISRVQELFEVDLSCEMLFVAPTVRQLSGRVGAQWVAQEALWIGTVTQSLRRDIDEMHDDEVLARISALESSCDLREAGNQRVAE